MIFYTGDFFRRHFDRFAGNLIGNDTFLFVIARLLIYVVQSFQRRKTAWTHEHGGFVMVCRFIKPLQMRTCVSGKKFQIIGRQHMAETFVYRHGITELSCPV